MNFCVNCKWFVRENTYCQSPKVAMEPDLIWGGQKPTLVGAESQRLDSGSCGPNGKLFEPKEPEAKKIVGVK